MGNYPYNTEVSIQIFQSSLSGLLILYHEINPAVVLELKENTCTPLCTNKSICLAKFSNPLT